MLLISVIHTQKASKIWLKFSDTSDLSSDMEIYKYTENQRASRFRKNYKLTDVVKRLMKPLYETGIFKKNHTF